MKPEFVAVDGEADSDGRYILLCDSLGNVLHNPKGIDSEQAFEFLLTLKAKHRQIVCFGLNYDVNQWLKDLTEPYLRRLVAENKTVWKFRYRLQWLPSKYFAIRDNATKRTVKVCEVFGFFQASFVNSLKAWGFEPPAEIETMKQRRGTFTGRELDRVVKYCQAECKLLVALMDKLATACEAAGCLPQRDWIGAGAIASSLLSSQGVKTHHAYDADIALREVVEEFILGGYFGGRVEMLAQGVLPVCHTRDIRSAYPHAATLLPSLIGARTTFRKRFDPAINAIWRVKWSGQSHDNLAPFPVRLDDKSICYPASGEGTYHTVEVATALKLGYEIGVIEGWQLRTSSHEKPFHFIPRLFRLRAAMKQKGDAAEKAIKLGLNSVYGKLAQGYGFGPPPFQSYWWAGMITATTRARMLALAHRSQGVVMISTDGLFAAKPGTKGTDNATLGSWEPDTISELFCAQPGVYYGIRDGKTIVKSRGFFAREVDYPELRNTYEWDGSAGTYCYDSRRFIGLKVALHRNRLDLWRQWVTEERHISLQPQRKLVGETDRNGMVRLAPLTGPISSMPYVPKQSLYDDPSDESLENMVNDDQPHYEGMNDR